MRTRVSRAIAVAVALGSLGGLCRCSINVVGGAGAGAG